ncbi:DUF3397 family protein [Virgibacillus halodenitrificans]|uniref:DUF3397 family protein n=1 Tax=Virgibacillus halodenitrificans TaxID=1482 RepID=UPI00136E3CCB|nr:DUF3397 family protein [Virgibacillus halodenitrificans]MYL46552.1 DUF3397 family protein [Virgibacillus halodenitrificans]
MKEFIIYLISIFVALPILATWFTYLIARKVGKTKIKAIHITVYVTTILYIIAVAMLFKIIVGHTHLGYLAVLVLSVLCIIIFYQWRYNTEIVIFKAIILTWRITFLLFLFAYLLLSMVGIILRIFY